MTRPRAAALAVGAAAIVLLGTGVMSSLPSGRTVVEDVASTLRGASLPLAGAAAFLETTIPPLSLVFPGEWALLLGGAIAGHGTIPIVWLVLVVWVCSTVGDSVAFLIGRRFGRVFLLRHGRPLGVTEARLAGIDRWFARYGSATVALGRLVNFVRPVAPVLAGSTRLPYRRFLPWNMLGTLLFSLVYCGLGYLSYRSYDELVAAVGRGSFAVVAVLAAVTVVAVRRRHRRHDRRMLPGVGG